MAGPVLPGMGEMPCAVGLSPSGSEERGDRNRQEGSGSYGFSRARLEQRSTLCDPPCVSVVRC